MIEIPKPWFTSTRSGRRIAAGLDDEPMRDLREGERRLAGFILPPFQRFPVWSPEQQVRFIDSLWNEMPTGSYVINRVSSMNRDDRCADWLLDGQQRWTAIVAYTNNVFPVYGGFWDDLDIGQKRRFRSITLTEEESAITDPALCERVYLNLAYGGTPHDPLDVDYEMATPSRMR